MEKNTPTKPSRKSKLKRGTENVMFIDDEQALIKLGHRMLESLGYNVVSSISPLAGLEIFKKDPQRFDLIITDMTMPDMTGDTLAIEMIKIRPDISIILTTGYTKDLSEEEALDIGIKAFLTKPFSMNELAESIRNVLDD